MYQQGESTKSVDRFSIKYDKGINIEGSKGKWFSYRNFHSSSYNFTFHTQVSLKFMSEFSGIF